MGVGYSFICKTHKVSYYLGYGSYGTWLCFDEKETPESFDERYAAEENAKLAKNKNFRQCLGEHRDCDWTTANWDFYGIDENKALYAEIGEWGAPVVMISNYGTYRKIDMTNADKESPNAG